LSEARNHIQTRAENLEATVKERTRELDETQSRLLKSERLAAIGELAAMIGHDLRNPLTSMAGATYYVRTKASSRLSEKEMDMLATIERAIDYSNKIIDDLLEYSREIKLDRTGTNPESMLEKTLCCVEIPAGIRVVDETETEPRMEVDAERMKRVFINIIRNAFDAMPNGGMLKIRSQKMKDHVTFSFADTGTGMDKQTLQRIWTPLFTTKAKGMGFGLSICKRIIDAHGGKVSIESNVGKGTTVVITIPIIHTTEGEREAWATMDQSLPCDLCTDESG
jgi:signal transduction histidine kinase